MPEVWLHTNRRALALGMLLPAGILAASAAGLAWAITTRQHWLLGGVLAALAATGLWMLAELIYAMWQPRIAYRAGQLLVFLEPTKPTSVPVEIVECFFLGQGPSELPKLSGREPETQNVVIRLADSAAEWKHRDVKPALGHWCEGYITVRGSWCEPISPQLMKSLNERLAKVLRELPARSAQETAP